MFTRRLISKQFYIKQFSLAKVQFYFKQFCLA